MRNLTANMQNITLTNRTGLSGAVATLYVHSQTADIDFECVLLVATEHMASYSLCGVGTVHMDKLGRLSNRTKGYAMGS